MPADPWTSLAAGADAVHSAGGRIVIRLMHTGRIAHPDNTQHGRQPVAPSAIAPAGKMFTASGMQDMPEPGGLSSDEIEQTVDDFRRAAAAATAGGADGVEIHADNGYLVHQFLSSKRQPARGPLRRVGREPHPLGAGRRT